MKSLLSPIALAAASLVLTGCSTVINSHRQKAPMMQAYTAADNRTAQQEIREKLKEPHWYNSSTVNTGDEIMWRLEAGSLNFNMGNFAQSVEEFKTAERLIAEYDERAKVSMRDAGAEVGMSVTNLNTLPYRGFCRDRIALSIYKSLAYLGMNNESAFRAQLRRLRSEQKKVQDDFKEFFEAEKAELAAARENNPEAAKKADTEATEEKMSKDPKNAEYAEGLKEVKAVAHRGYGCFLNPAAIFLSGLGSIRDENFDNARIDFKRLYEAMPKNPMIRQYYATVLRAANRPVPAELNKVEPFAFPLERDCVYVIFANGLSASLRQIAVYFPIMVAWPMCEFHPAPFSSFSVRADGKDYRSALLADMDGILAQEFEERLPGIITRIVLSTLIKEAAYYGGLTAIWQSGMPPVVKGIVFCAVAIGGAAYRTTMNTADTRSWEILPKEFQLTQFPMPRNRNLTVSLGGNGTREVKLPEGCRSAIVFVNAPSRENTSIHVLPIQSK